MSKSLRKITTKEWRTLEFRCALVAENQLVVEHPIKQTTPLLGAWLKDVLIHRAHEHIVGKELPLK